MSSSAVSLRASSTTADVAVSFPEARFVAFVSAIAWAIGTNWLGEWYYPVRGIGLGDLFFLVWLMFALIDNPRRAALLASFQVLRGHALLLMSFVVLLLIATLVNAHRFGVEANNLFAIVRLLYFSVIAIFVHMLLQRESYVSLLWGFLIGVGLLTLGRLYDAQTSGAPVIVGIFVLKDPNVIGNMLGIGVLFCSLGVLAGHLRLSLLAAVGFAAASVATFSKGSWLMVVIGLAANMVAWVMLFGRMKRSMRRFIPGAVLIVFAMLWLTYQFWDVLNELVAYKLESTYQTESADYRYQFAIAALYAMADHPFSGLGFSNFWVVERLYPTITPEPTENAHNAFLQVGAVGGLLPLGVLLILFLYPFSPLLRVTRALFSHSLASLYVLLVFVVFFLSGSVQLQLIAQPFFWVFTGIVCGCYTRLGLHRHE